MIHPQFITWRDLAFSVPLKPENTGLGPVQVLIADWHRGNGIISLVLTADGAISLYLSNGSSILGSGKFPKVLSVANELMRLANQFQPEAQQVYSNILPDSGQLQFYFRKADTLYWLPAGTDPTQVSNSIIELFKAMNNVISCIRESNLGG